MPPSDIVIFCMENNKSFYLDFFGTSGDKGQLGGGSGASPGERSQSESPVGGPRSLNHQSASSGGGAKARESEMWRKYTNSARTAAVGDWVEKSDPASFPDTAWTPYTPHHMAYYNTPRFTTGIFSLL